MSFYKPSRKYRYAIAELLDSGKTLEEAEDIVMKGVSNRAKYLRNYSNQGLFPYGELDPPMATKLSSRLSLTANASVAQPSVVQLHDTVAPDRINEVIDERLDRFLTQEISLIEARIKALEEQLSAAQPCSASVVKVKLRPRLKRSTEDTIPTSFRFPKELIRRARAKAKNDPIGNSGLNALVETLLWEYIGSPQDLLENS